MSTTLTAYRVPPQMEFKAARELRQNGNRAYLPTERHGKRKAPVARGYIFADGKPNEAKHVRKPVGQVQRPELIRLYPRRDRGHTAPEPFKAGDIIVVSKGTFTSLYGTVVEKTKRGWDVDVSMFGRVMRVSLRTHSMRKHDPGVVSQFEIGPC